MNIKKIVTTILATVAVVLTGLGLTSVVRNFVTSRRTA